MNKISEGRRQLSPILKTCFSDGTMKTVPNNLCRMDKCIMVPFCI